MKIQLQVYVEGIHASARAGVTIPELVVERFAPVDVTDFRLAGGVSDPVYRVVMEMRKDAAEILSKQLTEIIISAMSENDTRDGYAIGRQGLPERE